MQKSKKVSILSSIVLVGFFVAIVFHYVIGFYLHTGYPANTFLLQPDQHFMDFTGMVSFIKGFAPFDHATLGINYFPLAYIILFPFSLIKNLTASYMVFLAIFLSFWIFVNTKFFACKDFSKLQNFQNIFILTLMTYPFLFLLDRGNFDMMVLIFISLFIHLFGSKKYLSSGIVLGLTNAIKPFFLIFSILYLIEKKYKEFFLSIITTGLVVIGGFMILKGNFFDQIAVFIQDISIFQKTFYYDLQGGLANCSSLYLALKMWFCSSLNMISTVELVKIYQVIGLVVSVVTVIFAWREKIFWKRIALLTLYVLVMPFVTFDYRLIFLFIPLWLFVKAREHCKFDLVYAILFGLLLIPKRFLWVGTPKLVLLSVALNPLLMLAFMVLIIVEQFVKEKK